MVNKTLPEVPPPRVPQFFSVYYSAIIEHTNQVIFLEDDDVAAVMNGSLTIHRLKRNFDDPNESTVREVISLQMEIQQIMKGTVGPSGERPPAYNRQFAPSRCSSCIGLFAFTDADTDYDPIPVVVSIGI